MILSDLAAERAVLAGICRNGHDVYLDIADIISSTTFTNLFNQAIYDCIKHTFNKDDWSTIDVPIILSSAQELGISHLFDTTQQAQHLQAIFNFPVNPQNVRRFAAKIRKLEIARLLKEQLENAQNRIVGLTGEETITHILGIAEDSIFDFSSMLHDTQENEPLLIGEGLLEYVKYLGENPVTQIGVSTGFKEYDRAIGGGLRGGTVSIIAARPKCGKTICSDNIGYYIADTFKIPVLNLDTEMLIRDHQHRLLAMITDSYIYDIETGQYVQKPGQKDKIENAAQKLEQEKVPYYHLSIAGLPFEEQIAIMRRWLVKQVGFTDDGKAKPCVIIYDYLKLMTSEGLSADLKEYQMLGFMMTSLHNFAVRYNVPFLAFMQLNRDGITKEGTDTASGSDRIIWLCSNFTIFKRKSDEEIAEDGPEAGNRKLVPIVARHGAEFETGDYINCHMKGECAKITEGDRKFVLYKKNKQHDDGFVVEDNDDNDDVPFQ